MTEKRKVDFLLTIDDLGNYLSWRRVLSPAETKKDFFTGLKTTTFTDGKGYFFEDRERWWWTEKDGRCIDHVYTEWWEE